MPKQCYPLSKMKINQKCKSYNDLDRSDAGDRIATDRMTKFEINLMKMTGRSKVTGHSLTKRIV